MIACDCTKETKITTSFGGIFQSSSEHESILAQRKCSIFSTESQPQDALAKQQFSEGAFLAKSSVAYLMVCCR